MELKEIKAGDFILAEPKLVKGEKHVITVIRVDSIQPGGVMSKGKHYHIKKYTFRAYKRKTNNV